MRLHHQQYAIARALTRVAHETPKLVMVHVLYEVRRTIRAPGTVRASQVFEKRFGGIIFVSTVSRDFCDPEVKPQPAICDSEGKA